MNEQPIRRDTEVAPTAEPTPTVKQWTDKNLLGFYNYSIIATLVGLCISVIGICFSVVWPLPQISVYCLLLAAAVHLIDGKIAKTRELTTEEAAFGRTLDLVSDLAAFVLLPLAIGYATGMETAWFLPFALIWLIAGVVRLSFLYVTDAERRETGTRHRQLHLGLPTSSIALILPLFFLLRNVWKLAFPWLYAVLLVLVAALSLCRFRLPKWGFKGTLFFLLLGIIEMFLLAVWG